MPEALKRVGRYDLLEVIGRGGAAVVYLARQRDLHRNVALKELAPYHLADSSFAERFVEESRLAGAMNHANVVTVHEYFEDAGVPYIAMEYLPRGSLRQYVGRLSTAQIAGVLEGVLAGLAHGEAHRIVHRDLKPENLLVTLDGRVKIADFGVARAYSNAATRAVVTVAGTTIGTPTYMSPEQALGTDLTPATDLYSLGVVAWELVTGQVPFEETDTPVAVLYRHVHEPVPSVRSLAPGVDERIAAWLERMLAKRPEGRFQSADEAWLELEDVILDLLGPRWRRSARLVAGDAEWPAARTLTPAPFNAYADGGAAPDARSPAAGPAATPAPVAETVDGLDADAAAATGHPQTTIAPSKRRQRSHTTMLRSARRHRDGAGAPGAGTPDARRRRLIALAIVAAMAVAAVAGVLVAGSGSVDHRAAAAAAAARRAAAARATAARAAAARTARRVAAAQAATDTQLSRIAHTLAVTGNQDLARFDNATTPQAQARDIAIVQRDYVTAAEQVARFAGSHPKSPKAKPLQATLTSLAADYGRVAAAARDQNATAYNRAWRAVRRGDTQLQHEVIGLPKT